MAAPVVGFLLAALGGLWHLGSDFFQSVLLEIGIKGPGYIICRSISPSDEINPDGGWVVITGLLFWALLGGGAYITYHHFKH